MGLPATIRTNVQFPFPSLVQGSGPITIAKAAGIWTVGFTIANMPAQNPPAANYATDYILIWDSVANTFLKVSLSSIAGIVRTQRSVTASPIVIASTDMILNCNIPTAATCTLPLASNRSGLPLTFNDAGAQFSTHNLVITPSGTDKIDGAANLTLATNRAKATLTPYNDGVNTGWYLG